MLSRYALKQSVQIASWPRFYASLPHRRDLHHDGRNRLSSFWTPTHRQPANAQEPENGHDLLVRAGFVRPAHSGIFHLLPLGLRVQSKIEQLIDKHMLRLGASKVSLSSISSEELWQRSGRLDKGRTSELLRLEDRKGAKYLLSPTHEEEITTIVANAVHSYKELPLRLYQVSRKYRDEPRPRQGLLRGREFVMKDLYTFDVTEEAARQTYEDVQQAYRAFFDELRLPYLVATADSGNMGGDLSHEYHFASPQGEDTVIHCKQCDYMVNDEKYVGYFDPATSSTPVKEDEISTAVFTSKDRQKLVCVFYPGDSASLNVPQLKVQFPEIDITSRLREEQHANFQSSYGHSSEGQTVTFLRDPRISAEAQAAVAKRRFNFTPESIAGSLNPSTLEGEGVLLTKAKEGDPCPQCKSGRLDLQRAIEIAHTFHLGTRYSKPLEALILNAENEKLAVEMGCHGIGVSRLVGAIASLLMDKKGLNWPSVIAPFSVVVVPGPNAGQEDVNALYDQVTDQSGVGNMDAVIDDRERPIGWKLNDADLIGYPFTLVMGRAWSEKRAVEVQCRRLGIKEEIFVDELVQKLQQYSKRL